MDFLVTLESELQYLIEVKWQDASLSGPLQKFQSLFPSAKAVQLVGLLSDEKTYPSGAEIRRTSKWLSEFSLGPQTRSTVPQNGIS